jgi:enoyl-CoA hydratase/carnithine racemase
MNLTMWHELRRAFQWVDATPEARFAILEGEGKVFTAGIDLICCADMRYCSANAVFSIKEIDIGMTAEVGTLQRPPRLIGEGLTRELAYTAHKFDATEALHMRLVNRVFDSRETLQAGVHQIATTIAAPPLYLSGLPRK